MRLGCAVDAAQAPCRGMVVRSSIGTMSISSRVPACAGELPVRRARRALIRLRAWLHQPRLDAALAAGADPWSNDELYVRAVGLIAPTERRDLARALEELVARAHAGRQGRPYRRLRKRQPSTSYPTLRRAAVLSHHAALMELSARLREPGAVPVSVIARLMLLCCARSSPIFTAGRPVEEIDEIMTECLDALDGSAEPPQPQSSDSDTRRS